MAKIGIIGGSGLYEIEGLKNTRWEKVDTPFGEPSDEYMIAELAGAEIAFLPRHGRGHKILPTELNYTANIYGMKKLGVDTIISVSAVGSFKEEIKPLDILIPDQYVDRTNQGRKTTFFGDGIVAHVSLAEPSCPVLADAIYNAGRSFGLNIHKGGTYLNMEGPAFSTKGESLLYKSWGMDVIGMTNMPEARCAREAEICYVTMAMVTDYDCWHTSEDVTIDMIIQNLLKNVDSAKKILKEVIPGLSSERGCGCNSALKDAIVTRPELIPEETKKKLDIIIGKYIK
ncbi:MAG: S-methyl-5'-thioadenosine phosphorylase [Candidatus Omnitrophica bacterium]|nr:S-methyl-5'-thioadenosine phosphorylase [Candidatus Omnitrophota bacterium]